MSLEELNESQRKAANFEGKHLLVLAGAGTGKTKTIIARASYLISKGVSASKIQILTFTKRSASEIVSRVKSSLTNNQAQSLNGSTFHSWCNKLLTNYPNLFGVSGFTIIDEDDQVSIMKIVCGKKSIIFEDIKIKPQSLLDLYSFARNTKRNLTETIRFKIFEDKNGDEIDKKILPLKKKIEEIIRSYEQKKKERKYLDYDDIIQIVANRIKLDNQAKKILSSQYEHILVDEMQDTNPLQWDLLEPFQEICNLFCVGDDAQSIYSFRGADFKNVHLFSHRVKDSEVYKLQDNYRSTQEILDISNWLLEQSTIDYNKKLISVKGGGKTPIILNIENEWEEANFIADRILDNYINNNKLYSDHLILSRSQFYTTKIQAIFLEKKIPYITYGGRKFMESAHIKDLISALRVVNNFNDEIAWIRFLTLWEGIGEIRASKYIENLLELKSISECIVYLSKIHKNDSNSIIPKILSKASENKGDLQKLVDVTYELMEKRLSEKYKEDWVKKRKSDFPVLSVLAGKYSSLGEFISECILDNSTNVNNSPSLMSSDLTKTEIKDVAIISTIHSAKGLESDICFIVNVSPRNFPSSLSINDIDQIEEERRVLYVALTRAKNELIITRNLSSINSERKILESLEEGCQIENSDQEQRDKKILETYFLNALPEKLAKQEIVKFSKENVGDIKKPNQLIIDYGIDFS